MLYYSPIIGHTDQSVSLSMCLFHVTKLASNNHVANNTLPRHLWTIRKRK